MALKKLTTEFPLSTGIDSDSSSLLRDMPRLVLGSNIEQREAGEVSKRRGFDRIGRTFFDDSNLSLGGTLANGTGLQSSGSALYAFTGDEIAAASSAVAGNQYLRIGPNDQQSVTSVPWSAAADATSTGSLDDQHSGDVVEYNDKLFVFTPGINVYVLDALTGAQIQTVEVGSAALAIHGAAEINGKIVCVAGYGTPRQLGCFSVDPTTLAVTSITTIGAAASGALAGVLAVPQASSTSPSTEPNAMALVYWDGTNVTTAWLRSNLTVGDGTNGYPAAVTYALANAPYNFSLAYDASNLYFVYSYPTGAGTSDVRFTSKVRSTLAAVASNVNLVSDNGRWASCGIASSAFWVLSTRDDDAYHAAELGAQRFQVSGFSTGAPTIVRNSVLDQVGLAACYTHPVYAHGHLYAWCQGVFPTGSGSATSAPVEFRQTSNAFDITETTNSRFGFIAASLRYPPAKQHRPKLVSTHYFLLQSDARMVWTLVRVETGSGMAQFPTAALGSMATQAGGSLPLVTAPSRTGLTTFAASWPPAPVRPSTTSSVFSGTGTTWPAGTYVFTFAQYCYTGSGDIIWGSTSTYTETTTAAKNQLQLKVSGCGLGYYPNGYLGVWISYNGSLAVPLSAARVGSNAQNVLRFPSTPITWTQTTVGTDPHTQDQNQPALYTITGELDHRPPPATSYVTAGKSRFFAVDAQYPHLVLVTSKAGVGSVPFFSDGFAIDASILGEPVTAVAELDNAVAIFSRNKVAMTFGDGPAPNGADQWAALQRITGPYGCSDPRSVVEVGSGIIFLSDRGPTLLSRGGEIKPILEGRTLFDGKTVRSVANYRKHSIVVWGLSDGSAVVYNYDRNAWYTWTGHTNVVASTIHLGNYIWLDSSSYRWERNESSFQDNSSTYSHSFRVGWHTADKSSAQQFGRWRRFSLLGARATASSITVNLYKGYDSSSPVQTSTWSDAELPTATPLQLSVHVADQKTEAYSIEVSCTADNEGSRFSAVAIEYGVKERLQTLPSGQRK